jgi:uncharacterized protein
VTEAAPPDVLRRMGDLLNREAAPPDAALPGTAADVPGGRRDPKDVAARLLRGVRGMNESATYQAIPGEGEARCLAEAKAEAIAKGKAAGEAEQARRMLLLLGQERFGPPGGDVVAAIERITDHQQAGALIERLPDVMSWDELLAPPALGCASRPAEGRSLTLEGLVTTLDPQGVLNIAPMGPRVDGPDPRRFVLRPYQTSTTYRNLKVHGEGVLHVTDDVLLLARAAIGQPRDVASRPAEVVRGRILTDACRYYEFRVTDLDDREARPTIRAEAVAQGHLRAFFGLNRAKHAVVEAAILATRTGFLPLGAILAEYRKLAVLVEKTGGDAEHAALDLLTGHVRGIARGRGLDPDGLDA